MSPRRGPSLGTVAKRAYAEHEKAEERRRAYAEYEAQKRRDAAEQHLKKQKEHENFVADRRALKDSKRSTIAKPKRRSIMWRDDKKQMESAGIWMPAAVRACRADGPARGRRNTCGGYGAWSLL